MGKVHLRCTVIPAAAMTGLSLEHKYSLNLLGHRFNEILALSKCAAASHLQPGEKLNALSDPEKSGFLLNMMMFVRMLAGKIYEAQLKINSPLVKDFLLKRCFPNMEEREKDRLKEFNREVTKCRWLAAARNGHAMHYPTFDYWRDSLEKFEESEIAFRYYFGRKIGDVLYETADLVAGNAFVLEADGSDWRAGVSTAIVDLERISGIVAEFIVTCVQGFERGVQDPRVEYKRRVKRKDVKRIDVPHIEDLMIPFFLDTKTKA